MMTIPKPMACVIVHIINAVAKGEKSAISCCHVYYSGLGPVAKRTLRECGGTTSSADDVVTKSRYRILG